MTGATGGDTFVGRIELTAVERSYLQAAIAELYMGGHPMPPGVDRREFARTLARRVLGPLRLIRGDAGGGAGDLVTREGAEGDPADVLYAIDAEETSSRPMPAGSVGPIVGGIRYLRVRWHEASAWRPSPEVVQALVYIASGSAGYDPDALVDRLLELLPRGTAERVGPAPDVAPPPEFRVPEGRVLFVRWRPGGWQACGPDGLWRRYLPADVPALALGRTHVAVLPYPRDVGDEGPVGVFPIAGWLAGAD